MIRFILLQNRQGKTRLAKYYVPLEESEKHKVEYEVHRLVVNRDPKFTNFVEFRTHKVIYRRYAGLFFSMCVDITDNELAYLECIHLFVEILDHFFSNVCELDLVFNFHKVCHMICFMHFFCFYYLMLVATEGYLWGRYRILLWFLHVFPSVKFILSALLKIA
ncbi:unnamed protein product [Victoria cruziana]